MKIKYLFMATICLAGFVIGGCDKTNDLDPDTSTDAKFKDGVLPGKFSVSSDKQVQFSQGNLQYQASTATWRFAGHQYDVLRDGNVNISPSYEGWIDLFGWGTGNNPTLASEDGKDYTTFTEWGINIISNGGNIENQWRTLEMQEWTYIFRNRASAESLFGMGSVNGVNGVILLPDDWNTPEGLSFNASTQNGLQWKEGHYEQEGTGFITSRYTDEGKNHFLDNTYTTEQWEKMEDAGAVFLPTGWSRWGTNVEVGAGYDFGQYWTSNPEDFHSWLPEGEYLREDDYSKYSAYILDFNIRSELLFSMSLYRAGGTSVRLVHK